MGFFNRKSQPNDTPLPADDESSEIIANNDVTDTPTEAPVEPDGNARTFDTALGAGSVLEGNLASDGNVRLDGKFKGTLDIKKNVLVGVTADIEADIAAQNVTIAGVVRGDVSGGKVHLLATARVTGNIEAVSLITEDGAFIDGRVRMGASEGDTPPALDASDIATPEEV
jgi:cytoskeletal protein CcmA (bactofilin family)